MSAQTDGPYGPLIPMPELNPDALRAAVARIAPSRVPALTQHLFDATTLNVLRAGLVRRDANPA